MQVIGLTGGVGSGKSLAAEILQKITGGELLIADHLGHLLIRKGTEGYERVLDAFGEEILSAGGEIDRGKLAEKVFGREDLLQQLNGIIHPQVVSYIEDYIAVKKAFGETIILESAILFETGCEKFCDEVWYVWVPEQVRIRRLQESRGYSREKCQAIMAQQMQEEEYRDRCSHTIRNDGSVEELEEALRALISD